MNLTLSTMFSLDAKLTEKRRDEYFEFGAMARVILPSSLRMVTIVHFDLPREDPAVGSDSITSNILSSLNTSSSLRGIMMVFVTSPCENTTSSSLA